MSLSKQWLCKFSEISNQGCKREVNEIVGRLICKGTLLLRFSHSREGCLKGIIWLFNASGKETLSLQITGVLAGILKRM